MTDYLLLPLTFLCTYLGCRLIVVLANRHQWLDRPNDRSSHVAPTPTGGGLAMVAVFSIAALVAFANESPGFNHYLVLVTGIIVAAMGFADDVFSLGIWPRIGIQLLGVLCALALFGIPPLPLFELSLAPGTTGYLVAALLFLWFINLFNFMDGIDGLAGAETLFISASILIITAGGGNTGVSTFLLLLIAVVCGFLLLNLAPAKLFMGDVGSNFLGYLLGLLALASTVNGDTSLWTWLILAGVFLVDATLTLFRRMLNGEKWYYAHRSHAYQRAAIHLGSHGRTVLLVSLVNACWLLPLAWLSHGFPRYAAVLTLIAWLPLALLVLLMARVTADTQPA